MPQGQLVVTEKGGGTQTVTADSSTKITDGPMQQGQHVTVIVKDGHATEVRVRKGQQG
ncbi:MAG: hypothetical protein JOZ47_08370 [Kutzneria sp.]|nr:hypothetical protein [Kutzneria sp.]